MITDKRWAQIISTLGEEELSVLKQSEEQGADRLGQLLVLVQIIKKSCDSDSLKIEDIQDQLAIIEEAINNA